MSDFQTPDICIIGSGAGASPVAYTLAHAGYKVVVLEKGGWVKTEEFSKDELACCAYDIYNPSLQNEQHVLEEREEKKWVATPTNESGWSFWNGCIVGGATNFMSGFFHRMKPKDFQLASFYPIPKSANIVDWPLSYEELEPYYTKAEKIIGISGEVGKHSEQEWRSSEHFPYPKTQEHPISSLLDQSAKRLGFTSFPTPRAILSTPKEGRRACEYAGYCGSYGCSSGAKGSGRAALLEPALATQNLEIRPHSHVIKLDMDIKERITAVHYINKENQKVTLKATIFVVACGAIESARLLLLSKNRFHPNGIGNHAGELGKNLIFSSGGIGKGSFYVDDFKLDIKAVGPFVNRSLQDFYEINQHGKKRKGGTVDFLFSHNNPLPKAKQLIWNDDTLIWGEALQEKLLHHFTQKRVLDFEIFCDWTPHDDCFVTLDETIKDRYGNPVAKVRIGAHESDFEVGEIIAKKCEALLEEMGAKEIYSNISTTPPQNLQAGGCRFGDDPKSSVLDKTCKVHFIDNLYLSDGSFMPTGGSVPFTWTIYANAFRVADKILEKLNQKS
jgi:choline dehydrogenase-like flavoprotein